MFAPRRTVLAGLLAAPTLARAETPMDAFDPAKLEADIARYVAAGPKHAGGPADQATGAWLDSELAVNGFTTRRQSFEAPFFEPAVSSLTLNERRIDVLPQAVVTPTPAGGVRGPLRFAEQQGSLAGAIAVIVLPHARWSTLTTPQLRAGLDGAFARGARAAVIVTTGPTGEAIALNAPAGAPLGGTVAILAPRSSLPVVEAARAGATATLEITGRGGMRPAFNVSGRIERARDARWLVVSTPRSGWTQCAGERGPGLAVWLALARWTPRAFPRLNLAFVCNSGHEYENLGAEHLIRDVAPPPSVTALWLHLGANVAARDWHERGPQLSPLPSADPQRFLVVSSELLPHARRAFAGQPGLESPYPTEAGVAGELGNVVAAGYTRTAGVFGVHRFHHVAGDDMRVIEPALVARAAVGFRDFLTAALAQA